MLQLSKISTIVPYSDEWWGNRKGKLTSSKIFVLCGDRGIGDGGMTYIRAKVMECITDKSSERNITTEETIWGVDNEPKSLINYNKKYCPDNVIVIDKHLIHDDLFTGTPDGLVILQAFENQYEVETLETKSYKTYATHMAHCECETPAQIKLINKQLYWQVISQMLFCDCLVGNATFFHPDAPETSPLRQHRVVFRKKELIDDFRLLKNRMEDARTIYNKLLNKFK